MVNLFPSGHSSKSPSDRRVCRVSSSETGSSVYGQNIGSAPTQTSPFRSATGPPQPTSGSRISGLPTPFGASSSPASGATSTTLSFNFTSISSPTFGSTGSSTAAIPFVSTPAFGQSSAFGSQAPTLIFVNTGIGQSGFGASSTPALSFFSTPAFGAQMPTSAVDNTGIGQFGFGGQRGGSRQANYTPTRQADKEAIPWVCTCRSRGPKPLEPKFNNVFSHARAQAPTSTFGYTGLAQFDFGGQRDGSRAANHTPTTEVYGTSAQTAKLESISAMPIYKDKNHEELRWEDYQLGDKGGPNSGSSTTQTNCFAQSSASPFSFATPSTSNPFPPKTSTFTSGLGTSPAPSFSSSAFTSTSPTTPSIFAQSSSPFGAISSPSPSFGPSPSGFSFATSSPLSTSIFGNTQSCPTTLTMAQPGSGFGQTPSPFGQTSFNQTSMFSQPSSAHAGNIFSSSSALTSGQTATLASISAMPIYKDKNLEELRWEDYQLGDKESSVFGQKPAFGCWGSSPSQTNPFGSTNQPSQPAFGSNISGFSTPFGAPTQPSFGSTNQSSQPAFGSNISGSSTPFGAPTHPSFGSTGTPAFGSTSIPAFGSTSIPTFGSTGSAFGASSNPFGSSSTSPFGASSTSVFGASSTSAFSFGPTPASSSAFGTSSLFGSTTSPFEGQSSAFGVHTATSAVENTGIMQSGYGDLQGGSREASYTLTKKDEASP